MQHPAFGDRIKAFNQRWRPGILAAALAVTTVAAGIAAPPDTVIAKDNKSDKGSGRATSRASTSPSNTTQFVINDGSNATPYFTGINVTGLNGAVQDVNVIIRGLQHTNVDDVDILLESPDGRAVVVLGDVGGDNSVSGVNLVLDDSAPDFLPDGSILISGTFKPTNIGDDDAFGFPAPNTSGTTLGAFNGGAANGTWNLYIRDDLNNQKFGRLVNGWGLTIQTADFPPVPPPVNKAPVARNDSYRTFKDEKKKINIADGVLKNDYSLNGGKIVTNGVITKPKHGTVVLRKSGSFDYNPNKGYTGKDTFTYQIRDQTGGLTARATVTIQVKPDPR